MGIPKLKGSPIHTILGFLTQEGKEKKKKT